MRPENIVNHTCSVCGMKHTFEKSKEFYKTEFIRFFNEDRFDDFDDLIEVCPNCGNTALNIESKINPELLKDEEFLSIEKAYDDELEIEFRKAMFLALESNRYKEYVDLYLMLLWYNDDVETFLRKKGFRPVNFDGAILIDYLLKERDNDDAKILTIDLFRIFGDKDNGLKYHEIFDKEITDLALRKILWVEKVLLERNDKQRIDEETFQDLEEDLDEEYGYRTPTLRTIENYLIYELDVTGPDLYGVKDRLLSEDYFGVIRLRKSPKINEIDKICEINEDGKRIIYLYDKSIEKIRIIKLSFDGDEYYVEVVDRHIDTYLEKCALELANKLDRILNYKD